MIEEHSDGRGVGRTKRNSRYEAYAWRREMTREQVAQGRTAVEDVASAFYSDDDWAVAPSVGG